MARPSKKTNNNSYLDKLGTEVESNQSRLSLVLGALIVLVVGILVFNYINRNQSEIGPSQQTQQEEGDVSPQNLPGRYTVKEGDTLFTIAEKYYNDGYKYSEVAKANNLVDVNLLEVGQRLEIPKLETISPTSEPTSAPATEQTPTEAAPGSKGAPDITMTTPDYGPRITGSSYTVVEGDWLSKIAARAYGDILSYDRLAKANNISNPNLIIPGQVLTIPR